MAEIKFNARVLQKIDVTADLMIMRIVPDGWEIPQFKAGQFAVLGLPGSSPRHPSCDTEETPADPAKLIRRAYSIASSPEEREYIEFYIMKVSSGALTPRLWNLKPGDPLWIGPKFTGMFTLDEVPGDANIVLMATGTGLAPYMSMLRSFLLHESSRRIAALHGARHSWDLGYRSELQTLNRLFANFNYFPVLDEPEKEAMPWTGHTGFVQELWSNHVIAEHWGFEPTPDNTHIFLCGNPLMIKAAVSLLEGRGFKEHTKKTPGEIHLEKFW